MRKNLNKIYTLSPLVLGLMLISAGCSSTPKQSGTTDTADSMVKETMVMEEEKSTTVYKNAKWQASLRGDRAERIAEKKRLSKSPLKK